MSDHDGEPDAGRVLMDERHDDAGADAGIAGALRALPQGTPPRGAWQAIRRRAAAEGLIERPRRGRLRRDLEWLAGGALAATVVFTLLDLSVFGPGTGEVAPPADESRFAATPAENSASLGSLMERSRMLERALREAPETPRVMRASTAGTIATLEDRIAMIDQQLSYPERPLSEEEVRILWRERVQLMDSLVQLRYAQARRVVL